MYIDKQALYESFLSRGFDDACARLMAGLDPATVMEAKDPYETSAEIIKKKIDEIMTERNNRRKNYDDDIKDLKERISIDYERLEGIIDKYRKEVASARGKDDPELKEIASHWNEYSDEEKDKIRKSLSYTELQNLGINIASPENNGVTTDSVNLHGVLIESDTGTDGNESIDANKKQEQNPQVDQNQQVSQSTSTNQQQTDNTTGKEGQVKDKKNQQKKAPAKNKKTPAKENATADNKKYGPTDETIEWKDPDGSSHTLHRIRFLKDFGDVKKGDLGGWIESWSNLSQEGNCYTADNSKVFGNASVSGDAQVYGNAQVYGDAKVSGTAHVYGDARIYGDANVGDGADVNENAEVFGNAVISDSKVTGDTKVNGDTKQDNTEGKEGQEGEQKTGENKTGENTKKSDEGVFPPLNYPIGNGKELGNLIVEIRKKTYELLQKAIEVSKIDMHSIARMRGVAIIQDGGNMKAVETESENFERPSERIIYDVMFGEDGRGLKLDVFTIDAYKNVDAYEKAS